MPRKILVPNSFFQFLVIFALFALVAGVFAAWDSGSHLVWHDASEIKLSVGGVDYDLQETMDDLLAQMGLRITGVTAGTGLTGGGTTGNVTLNVNAGNAATTGLEINPVSDELRLSTAGCIAGEILKRNASNNGWECVADNTGAGDITGVTAGTGLTGGGTSGTVTVSADTTYLQRRVSSSCTAGSSIRAIAADGTVTCETDDGASGFWAGDGTEYANLSLDTDKWHELDLSPRVGNRQALVLLKVAVKGGNRGICAKPYSDTGTYECGWGGSSLNTRHILRAGDYGLIMTTTDNNGKIGLLSSVLASTWDVTLVGYA
jgi:hypothetical protein